MPDKTKKASPLAVVAVNKKDNTKVVAVKPKDKDKPKMSMRRTISPNKRMTKTVKRIKY